MSTINEVEAKIAINEKEYALIARTVNAGRPYLQSNSFYSLGKTIVRVRNEKENIIVCLKGPRAQGRYNSRKETEFHFDGHEFFNALNIKPFFSYEKRRAEVRFNGCTLSLDNLGEGKNYLEIEGKEKAIKTALKSLSMQNKQIEKRSYLEILGGIKWDA